MKQPKEISETCSSNIPLKKFYVFCFSSEFNSSVKIYRLLATVYFSLMADVPPLGKKKHSERRRRRRRINMEQRPPAPSSLSRTQVLKCSVMGEAMCWRSLV